MRLDHLLSKEHLPPKGGKEPAPSECGGGVLNGGDTGESAAGNGHHGEYALIFRGWWWKVGGGAAGSRRIAPCWVLKEQPLVGSSVPLIILVLLPLLGGGAGVWGARHGLASHTAGSLFGGLSVWCGAVGCGLVVC